MLHYPYTNISIFHFKFVFCLQYLSIVEIHPYFRYNLIKPPSYPSYLIKMNPVVLEMSIALWFFTCDYFVRTAILLATCFLKGRDHSCLFHLDLYLWHSRCKQIFLEFSVPLYALQCNFLKKQHYFPNLNITWNRIIYQGAFYILEEITHFIQLQNSLLGWPDKADDVPLKGQ